MSEEIQKTIKVLRDGGVVIFPTDTAYGIGCRIDREDSVERIYRVRKRPEEKALLVLVSSFEMAKEYVVVNKRVENELLSKYWPGGLTVILPLKNEKVPSKVRAGGDTLAVRFPDHKDISKIIDAVGVPIVAPSANFSGEPTPTKLSEVNKDLQAQVDFVLSGVCTMKGVSTIIDATSSKWHIVRRGVIDIKI